MEKRIVLRSLLSASLTFIALVAHGAPEAPAYSLDSPQGQAMHRQMMQMQRNQQLARPQATAPVWPDVQPKPAPNANSAQPAAAPKKKIQSKN